MSTLRGLRAISFKCPTCGGETFGYEGNLGHCRRVGLGAADDCHFTWPRRNDWRVFVRSVDGAGFRTPAELEALTGPAGDELLAPARENPFPHSLHRLISELLERPPTVAVVKSWTRDQQRLALHWASREIMAYEAGVQTGVREPRPAFIEDGAATA